MQRDGKQLEASLDNLIPKVQDIKNSIGTFLMKLENEYTTMTWPSVLDNFALLSGQLNSLGRLLKSERMPALRNYVFLPLELNPERDVELEKQTEGRVLAFNHEVVPDYLRTKPEPEVEEKVQQLFTKAGTVAQDNTQRQLNALTKITSNILDIINSAREDWENETSKKSNPSPTANMSDTNVLIAATCFGKGLKQLRRPDINTQQQITVAQQQAMQQKSQHGNALKAPSTIKTNIKSASSNHPYQRP
ncbi:mediator of RNA polymerase II transcription subunit 8-like isoform X2 [Liolophura sinensis]|uniref:mediator of RNA polymerase II transcription subunit 8-like isoform X2 n=1 Tax=Liolophura sinensis TaxID=3198878 RepID=UPI003158FB26